MGMVGGLRGWRWDRWRSVVDEEVLRSTKRHYLATARALLEFTLLKDRKRHRTQREEFHGSPSSDELLDITA